MPNPAQYSPHISSHSVSYGENIADYLSETFSSLLDTAAKVIKATAPVLFLISTVVFVCSLLSLVATQTSGALLSTIISGVITLLIAPYVDDTISSEQLPRQPELQPQPAAPQAYVVHHVVHERRQQSPVFAHDGRRSPFQSPLVAGGSFAFRRGSIRDLSPMAALGDAANLLALQQPSMEENRAPVGVRAQEAKAPTSPPTPPLTFLAAAALGRREGERAPVGNRGNLAPNTQVRLQGAVEPFAPIEPDMRAAVGGRAKPPVVQPVSPTFIRPAARAQVGGRELPVPLPIAVALPPATVHQEQRAQVHTQATSIPNPPPASTTERAAVGQRRREPAAAPQPIAVNQVRRAPVGTRNALPTGQQERAAVGRRQNKIYN